MIKKKVVVKQIGIKDCGACCLLSIIRYYNGNMPLEKIRDLTNTTKLGTNFYYLKEMATNLGMDTKGIKINKHDLNNDLLPAIAQVIVKKSYTHFVVIYNISKNRLLIMDPNIGLINISTSEFNNQWSGYLLMIKSNQKLIYQKENNKIIKLLLSILKANQKLLIKITLLSVLFTILSITYSFYFKITIDQLLTRNISKLNFISIVFGGLIIVKVITNFLRNQLLIYLNQKIDLTLMLNTFKHIILLPYHYFKSRTTGEIIAKLNDLSYVRNMISKFVFTLFVDLLLIVGGGSILYYLNPLLFLISLLIIISYISGLIIFHNYSRQLITNDQEQNAIVNSFLIEGISGFDTVKGLNIEEQINQKMTGKFKGLMANIFKLDTNYNIQNLFKDLITYLGILLIIYFGSKQVINNEMTIGTLVAYNSLLIYFLEPIRNLIDLEPAYHYAVVALKRANSLYEVEEEILNNESKAIIMGDIMFNNVNYTYQNDIKVLKNVNLEIKKGSKVLIVGPSGSGKSTLLNILYRYIEVEQKRITIGNIDLNDYQLIDIRRNMAYISQNELLFNDSIKDNIILNRNFDEEEFLKVCQITGVNEMIKNYPLGLETNLEEDGANLSGGERQRIILARTLLKPSQIFLIDEGTNELDVDSERIILKAIFNKFQAKTFIIISHRLENLDLYDRVVKMDQGTIINVISKNK